jgi:chromosome segregation ATPase
MLKEFVKQLMDPGTSSPLVPLIVFVVFVGIFGAVIFLVGKMLRAPETGEDDDTVPDSVIVNLREESRLTRFFRRITGRAHREETEEADENPDSESNYLRDKNLRLERENESLRELQAEALRELSTSKFKIETIETKLQEAIGEVERLYKSNAEMVGQRSTSPSPMPSNFTDVMSANQQVILKQTGTIETLTGQIQRLNEENEKLRDLLQVCRAQIVQIMGRQPAMKPPVEATAAAGK